MEPPIGALSEFLTNKSLGIIKIFALSLKCGVDNGNESVRFHFMLTPIPSPRFLLKLFYLQAPVGIRVHHSYLNLDLEDLELSEI